MNILSKIKVKLTFFYYEYIKFEDFEYKYLKIYKNEKLLEFIEEKALELAKKENLPVFNVSFDELNKDLEIKDENKKAVGVFRYIEKNKIASYCNKIKEYEKNNGKITNLSKDLIVPRIEMTELGDVFTLIHELGHYFIYKREQKQSEPAADAYCEEFFNEHLPPFFKWIFQIDIYVRTKKDVKYSSSESYNYFKEYNIWIKNNPQYLN